MLHTKRSAFSLLELMLVVVIIGIVYAIVLSSFKAPVKHNTDTLTLLTLPDYLRDDFVLSDVRIVCFEPCGSCNIIRDGQWLEDEIKLFDSSNVKSYTLDSEGFAVPKEFVPLDSSDPYRKACFVLHKRANGSIESIVLENEGKFIYYKAGYEKVKSYDSLSSLQNFYVKRTNEIREEL